MNKEQELKKQIEDKWTGKISSTTWERSLNQLRQQIIERDKQIFALGTAMENYKRELKHQKAKEKEFNDYKMSVGLTREEKLNLLLKILGIKKQNYYDWAGLTHNQLDMLIKSIQKLK